MQHSLLCLGDSYTIGEGVALHESFPYQLLQLLRKANHHFHAPEIVAKSGWTTFELAEHILRTSFNEHYDFVTLLIGVNNQYRELSADDFKNDFEFLLKKAIQFANKKAERVIVISIPDWSVTSYAKEKKIDQNKVSQEIDAYNAICEEITNRYKTTFINITDDTKKAKKDKELLVSDGLHYSAKAMKVWAEKTAQSIQNILKHS